MGTNYDRVEPLGKVKRWFDLEKADVPEPLLFQTYNRSKGGVDMLDQCMNNYRIRGKKWWWPLFTHMLNIAMVNSWILYQLANPDERLHLLAFQRYLTRHYVFFQKINHNQKEASTNVPESIRKSERGHFLKKWTSRPDVFYVTPG
jgi:hypothetical protein